jgi:hypothetical protein
VTAARRPWRAACALLDARAIAQLVRLTERLRGCTPIPPPPVVESGPPLRDSVGGAVRERVAALGSARRARTKELPRRLWAGPPRCTDAFAPVRLLAQGGDVCLSRGLKLCLERRPSFAWVRYLVSAWQSRHQKESRSRVFFSAGKLLSELRSVGTASRRAGGFSSFPRGKLASVAFGSLPKKRPLFWHSHRRERNRDCAGGHHSAAEKSHSSTDLRPRKKTRSKVVATHVSRLQVRVRSGSLFEYRHERRPQRPSSSERPRKAEARMFGIVARDRRRLESR